MPNTIHPCGTPVPQDFPAPHSAFTLTELLIVIAVMILLFSVAVPGISKLMNAGREDSALGSLGAAIATARSYADKAPHMPPGVSYQGTALIVTPANELRVVQHFDTHRASSTAPIFNWYRDAISQIHSDAAKITREGYIGVPKAVGLVGITRTSAMAPTLLAPPFALRFDPHGHLIVRQWEGSVVYSGDYDPGAVRVGPPNSPKTPTGPSGSNSLVGRRARDYSPNRWDPERSGKVPGDTGDRDTAMGNVNFHQTAQKYMLPFDTLDTVIGVIAFNKESVYSQFGPNALNAWPQGTMAPNNPLGNVDGNLREDVANWLLENGRVMFFNRYSGAVIKP